MQFHLALAELHGTHLRASYPSPPSTGPTPRLAPRDEAPSQPPPTRSCERVQETPREGTNCQLGVRGRSHWVDARIVDE